MVKGFDGFLNRQMTSGECMHGAKMHLQRMRMLPEMTISLTTALQLHCNCTSQSALQNELFWWLQLFVNRELVFYNLADDF